jgi:hypothetical protein
MSDEDQAHEIGNLLMSHSRRRQEYATITAKLRRIGTIMNQVGGTMAAIAPDKYDQGIAGLKKELHSIESEVGLAALINLLDQYMAIGDRLKSDLETLRPYGVER